MSASKIKEIRNVTREQPLLGRVGSTAPGSDSPSLTHLPDELLIQIVANLDLKDILNSRTVCRALRTACGSREAWRSMYLRQHGEALPRPFLMPKPIKECSADDIESSLQKWYAEWPAAGAVQRTRRVVKTELLRGRHPHRSTMVLTPGGRWAITGYADGSVWCFDLSDNPEATGDVEPFLLLPSTYPEAEVAGRGIQVFLSIDCASEEALGPTFETHHLAQFNVAIITCPYDYRSTKASTSIDIWRIHIPEPGENDHRDPPQLRLGSRLSTFKDSGTGKLLSCSLYGKAVAYSMNSPPSQCTVIVDWEEANGKNEDQGIPRWYVPDIASLTVKLLPGDRILTTHQPGALCVHNWRLDCPSSPLSPATQQLERITPAWVCGRLGNVCGVAISSFFVVRNSIRLVVPTSSTLYGLTIPKDSHDPSLITLEPLVKGYFGFSSLVVAFGLDRGAGVVTDDNTQLCFTRHKWNDDLPRLVGNQHTPKPTIAEYEATEPDLQAAKRLLYDQCSGRLFIFDSELSSILTLVNSPPTKTPVSPPKDQKSAEIPPADPDNIPHVQIH
ncbi:hypothetical protein D9611_007508 [Ephemerocybe angulata]|uniref:F-box domain-containing protein n=1 Tax=Ephemerocybe angulata TaxID=980116 RepID=A0A8H5FL95_9AGAR|nr:hypothetical protein D9611_007508 [Tulosesus angulatus]